VADVLREVETPSSAASIAIPFFGLLEAAGVLTGVSTRVRWIHAPLNVGLGVHLEMK
jgi:hypothetical protein